MIIGIVIVGVVGLWVQDYLLKRATGDPDIAKVGNCVSNAQTPNRMQVVSCTDNQATFHVVGKVDDIKEGVYKGDTDVCEPYPTSTRSFYAGTGGYGYVLCLAPRK
ncbi:LppU/SCO3897 family protein [Actinomadura scrupuli]|uniref:LppU/SCO3897 family protein n=1 Tax=Actinomadura scrupuli TaxID=559629 RepID=UPI003D974171